MQMFSRANSRRIPCKCCHLPSHQPGQSSPRQLPATPASIMTSLLRAEEPHKHLLAQTRLCRLGKERSQANEERDLSGNKGKRLQGNIAELKPGATVTLLPNMPSQGQSLHKPQAADTSRHIEKVNGEPACREQGLDFKPCL